MKVKTAQDIIYLLGHKPNEDIVVPATGEQMKQILAAKTRLWRSHNPFNFSYVTQRDTYRIWRTDK